jgi:uncharacterized protein (DUF305 family)
MRKLKYLLVAGAAGSALAIAACGSDESQSSPAGGAIDRAFAQAMIPHHQSAVEMAEVAQDRGESDFVTNLADDIVRTQSEEIEILRAEDGELAKAGVEAGHLGMGHAEMGMTDDPAMLEAADPFDEAFLRMMIPHHQGAIAMAKIELREGKDPELIALAQEIVDAQQREITEMRRELDGDQGRTSSR